MQNKVYHRIEQIAGNVIVVKAADIIAGELAQVDSAQGISDFMGDRGRHLAQGRQGFDPADFSFQLLGFGQVKKYFHGAERFILFALQ